MPSGVYQHKPITEITKKKMSLAKKGCKQQPQCGFQKGHPKYDGCGAPKGSRHRWLGENAGILVKHMWVKKIKGSPKYCEVCGKKGNYFTCIKKCKEIKVWNIHWANIDHKYRRVLDDYTGLCQNCHRQYDKLFNGIK